ncbi:NADH-quinone oxidoreductase subunit L [Blautia liquoris]|uniref:NADH-quinone oxidoreductase subunit L n=1 Tax=Blautia liquoris TaxID=2779518 RepID=A0A7M2RK95_9FIRM|nr:proton-conducting transporter membrane subunit [Blautia liquoris]QOV20414.1 NADH-quinone oxidoreductase subunit L [Blautia liquoris]
MELITLLILFPLLSSVLVFFVRNEKFRNGIMRSGALVTAVLTVLTVVKYFGNGLVLSFQQTEVMDVLMLAVEIGMAAYIIITGFKEKKYLLALFSIIQIVMIVGFEFTEKKGIEVHDYIVLDKLSGIMVLIAGIIGSLISIYAVGYMKSYHAHHKEVKERKSFFFSVIFIFLSAMFGLVLSNHLMWIYFCWEITTFCSYLLIGYTKTDEAKHNALQALTMNVGGGLSFAAAIVILGTKFHTLELSALTSMKPNTIVLVCVFLLCLAALTKSAQLPFSSWLLGAMVAPTPSSALLHSATMVKAGVYLIIRLAPLLGESVVGRVMTLIGAVTFLACSMMAITPHDAKKVLAYSTIANLGLIVMCASVGTQESLWAAILLVIFHAVSKSLMFLTVGSIENVIGSRNIENMNVLMQVSRGLSIALIIGICGMFLAPFGMLISKWVAMKSFIDSKNILIVVILAYGSAATMFYWGKWLGKLNCNRKPKGYEKKMELRKDEKAPIFFLTAIVLVSCLGYPLASRYAIVPYLVKIFGTPPVIPIGTGDQILMVLMIFMVSMLVLVPMGHVPTGLFPKRRETPIYMAGENSGDDQHFIGSFGIERKSDLSNWYMEEVLNTKKITFWCNIVSVTLLGAGMILLIGRWGM